MEPFYVPEIVSNTDLEAAFNLILNTAVKNKLKQSEMPKSLLAYHVGL